MWSANRMEWRLRRKKEDKNGRASNVCCITNNYVGEHEAHAPQNTTTKPQHTLIPKTDSKEHTHMVSISCIQSTSHYHDVHFDIK